MRKDRMYIENGKWHVVWHGSHWICHSWKEAYSHLSRLLWLERNSKNWMNTALRHEI